MYRRAFKTFTKNWLFFVVMSVMITIIEFFISRIGYGASLFAYCMVALISHRIILLDEDYGMNASFKGNPGVKLPIFKFGLKYFGFTLLMMILIGIGALPIILSISGPEKSFFTPRSITMAAIFIVGGLGAFGLVLATFGTCLPASAIGADGSFSAAKKRSQGQVAKTFLRLSIGPFAVSMLTFVAVFTLFTIIPAPNKVTEAALSTAIGLLGLFTMHLTAMALSMAYEQGEKGTEDTNAE